MTDTVNVITYETAYETVLQDRLDHPTTFKEMCDVTMTNTRVISTSYMSTTPAVTTVTRGTGHDLTLYQETAETLTISTARDLGIFMDWGDLAQSPWSKPAELFDRIGALLNEYIEGAVLGQHATWTDFDNASIGGGAGNITVSASNIDDIIRGVKREIREANGGSKINQNGVGFVWRAADFEYLEAFVQASNKIIGLGKSSLINGENPEGGNAQQAIPSPCTRYVQLQRLNERTLEIAM